MIKEVELEEINKLVAKLKEVETFCRYLPPNVFDESFTELRLGMPICYASITVDTAIIAPAVTAYRDKMKQRLRELGYEPD